MNTRSESSGEPLFLDVTSDVVCPWCFIGKRRIERAAKLLERPLLIRWHPFELNPGVPVEGMPRRDYRIQKFGSLDRSRFLEEQVETTGRQVGIAFRHHLIKRTPNTRRAHVLLELGLRQSVEVQNRAAERLFEGYFLRGEDIGDQNVLLDIATEVEIAALKDPEVLNDPALHEIIRRAEERTQADGVHAVPSIAFSGQIIASGAQPEELLADALRPFLSGMPESRDVRLR